MNTIPIAADKRFFLYAIPTFDLVFNKQGIFVKRKLITPNQLNGSA